MPFTLSRRSSSLALVPTALAALIIGCGGGGGGGHTTTSSGGSSASGGSTTATTSGDAGTIGGGTDGGSGALQANSIYFLQASTFQSAGSNAFDLKYVSDLIGGSATTVVSGISQNAAVASPDPSEAGQIVYAFAPAGSGFGIYRGTNPSTTTGARAIVSARYDQVLTVQVSRDGKKVMYVAAPSGQDPHLYVVATSGTSAPTLVDGEYVVAAELNSLGDRVVYEKVPSSGDTEIYVRDLDATTPVQFTNDAVDQDEPQFSKDGTKIVFSQDDGTGRHVIGIQSAPGGAVAIVDPFPGTDVSVRAPSLNDDGTRIAFLAEGGTIDTKGIFTSNLTGGDRRQVLETDDIPLRTLYWTNVHGRSPGGLSLHLNLPRRK